MRVRWYRARSLPALGDAVRGAREVRGLTQDQLADMIGSSRPTLSRLERGQAVSAGTVLDALARCGYEVVVVPRGAQVSVS
ncbi:helix-turn-helix domain-containing protein [Cellulomonas phragmiteti]